jgi:(1->4)-alpha-D-glucan 1-alpha-D-glucosylmutase
MHKAMREAKVYSNWLNPSQPHERAMKRFVEHVLAPDNTTFMDEFLPFQGRIARYGLYNSLAQVTLKIGAPGVPDFYQGTELWDFSLVDPDNRRSVDFERRRALLEELDAACRMDGDESVAGRLAATVCDDASKLFATSRLLRFRRAHLALFQCGGYHPLSIEGARREHLFAFGRSHGGEYAVMAVPRLIAALLPDADVQPLGERVWGDTRIELPADWPVSYRQVLTGRCVRARMEEQDVPSFDSSSKSVLRVADVFSHFPVALLESRQTS